MGFVSVASMYERREGGREGGRVERVYFGGGGDVLRNESKMC